MMIDPKQLEEGVKHILCGLGVSNHKEDQHLDLTPERVAKYFAETCRNTGKTLQEMLDQCNVKKFNTKNQNLVAVRDIVTYSVCPHHLAMVSYKVHVGYVPNGHYLGLSKIPRIVEELAKRPVTQEDYTEDVAVTMKAALTDINPYNQIELPIGVIVVVYGVHSCMGSRGVKKHGTSTITSSVKGCFRNPNEQARAEFISLIQIDR
jgi:GTP cyclohydrolase I